MPYKDFQVNEILTAADVNDYLMDQSVMTFADSTARDAAITSPTEGMFCFLKDTDGVEYYTGSSWVPFTSGGGGGGFETNFLLMGA
jgi:hypothetical protein